MSRQPNLLIIHTDQQSDWTLSCYGGDDTRVETPNIDRLASEGAKLTNFITNCAVCTPSRGCFFTGRHTFEHGAKANNIPYRQNEVTLAHVLKNAGYQTSYVGKWHLDGVDMPGWIQPERSMGFDDCRFMFNCGHALSMVDNGTDRPDFSARLGEGQYPTHWVTDRTLEILRNRSPKSPFFHVVSIPDPHTPYDVCEPYASMFDPDDVSVPPTFDDPNIPSWIRDRMMMWLHAFGMDGDAKHRRAILRRHKAHYCGEVRCIDDHVGRMLAYLEDEGILDETIVVFTTDHGDYMGEHGNFGKNLLYERAYRIPLLIRWPEAIPAGTVVDRLTAIIEFQPTVLSLMGIDPSGRESGRNAAELVRGNDVDNWRDEVLAYVHDFSRVSIYTRDYMLAVTPLGDGLLFDRQADPWQSNNLFHDADHRSLRQELIRRTGEHAEKVGATFHRWVNRVADGDGGCFFWQAGAGPVQ